ncbi:phage Gp37/Gp68 family protein [Paraburkholderia phymatum]|uniref:Gp37Gp68 family protein n=1 Tax=Paraburkholderia phymatum (strain DSM 17167 / CIP 108236 / LMG 21445 / STM815) TaxID=391038 RepID=B2JD47_PARP8|nr:phage Gp37/Gp68 family protein [Paraburkholderia phymatum]ACC71103.1 Gp37Gp68 family protein [Paraburkholderia phymatum STM815]
MSENSKIEWTDHTFNPWEGCQKVGPGCDHCYAETRNARFAGGTAINWGPGAPRRRTSPANWRKPLHWNAVHGNFLYQHGRRQRVFCASLADVFDNAVDPAWRADLFALIKQTPNLDWLLLTKRIGNVPAMLAEIGITGLPWNVWLGATIVNRSEMLRDAEKLLTVEARVRFWSVEPMLGDLGDIPSELLPDWVICGGESGHGARPMHPDWARSLRDQCDAAGVQFLFKQWGEWMPADADDCDPGIDSRRLMWSDGAPYSEQDGQRAAALLAHVGKKAAGRLLDGRTRDGFPRDAA